MLDVKILMIGKRIFKANMGKKVKCESFFLSLFQTTNFNTMNWHSFAIAIILKVIPKNGGCQVHQLLILYQFGMFDFFLYAGVGLFCP